ncbi:MAG: type III secretion system export apparatus subunit SctT [Puniceicoccales bacterium]|jgi:type III secretion protein T|nr:type III secretion system export apparatus subunit SctT [Puniceicoccales bacterium]
MDLPIKEIASICVMLVISMVRLGAAMSISPFFSRQFVEGTARNMVIFSLSLPLFYLVLPTLPEGQIDVMTAGFYLVKEVIIGIILGFAASFIFYASEGVGFVIDVQRGASMATIFDPMAGAQTSLMGSFLIQMMSVAFFSAGGFLAFLTLVYETYKFWPVFATFPPLEFRFAVFFMDTLKDLMNTLFCLAAPVLIVLFLAEFGLGMVNRFAPQLNVFFLSMPVKSWLSMMFLLLYLSVLGYFFERYFTVKSKLLEFVSIFVVK